MSLRSVALILALLGVLSEPLLAQDQRSGEEPSKQDVQSDDNGGVRLLEPQTFNWQMGLEITGGPGVATGVIATAPLPVEWPEQKVKEIKIDKSESVGRVTFKELDGAVKQMMVVIPRLQSGEVARVVVELEIEKRWIAPPENPDALRISESLGRGERKYLVPSPYIESRHPRILEIAESLAKEHQDESAWRQVEAIYEWVREHVEYRFDEQIKSCLDALDDGHGDCEELSSLFIAICRARGIPARAVWIPGHTYPEFYLEDQHGNGHWYPCQAAGAREFGAMSEDKPILQKGDSFKIHGHKERMRYVQPTLTAKDATASPMVKWILSPSEQ